MIVESTRPREIGEEFYLGFDESTPTGVRGKVLREATEEEYVADCLADPTLPEYSRKLTVVTGRKDLWWYEISVD